MMIVAKRILKIVTAHGSTPVEVRIYAPYQNENNWCSAYEIDWPGTPRKFKSAGKDSVQALLIALNMIGIELYSSAYHKRGELVFEKPAQGFGFPVPKNVSDVLEGQDALEF